MENLTKSLQLAEVRNLAPVRQESKPLKIGSDTETLKSCLRLQMLKVGIRAVNIPKDEEKQVLIDFVNRHFGNYTNNQISEAFDLAITGKLSLKDAGCYENFSCEYFGRIMAAYRLYLIDNGLVLKNTDNERMKQPEPKLLMPAPDWEPHIDELREKIQKGETPIIPTHIYDWLNQRGLIQVDCVSFMPEAQKQVIAKLNEEKTDLRSQGMSINQILYEMEAAKNADQNAKILVQAKRLSIIHYLKNS